MTRLVADAAVLANGREIRDQDTPTEAGARVHDCRSADQRIVTDGRMLERAFPRDGRSRSPHRPLAEHRVVVDANAIADLCTRMKNHAVAGHAVLSDHDLLTEDRVSADRGAATDASGRVHCIRRLLHDRIPLKRHST